MTSPLPSHCSIRWLRIEPDHPALPGHFPGAPVVPGVVLLDHVVELLQEQAGAGTFASSIPWVKFMKPVLPGQTVLLGAEALSAAEFGFTCRIGRERVAEGRVAFSPAAGDD